MWLAASLGFLVVLGGIALSLMPPGESSNKWMFEVKLIGCTVVSVFLGLILYYRGAREKAREAAQSLAN